jgi:hypothetical protein
MIGSRRRLSLFAKSLPEYLHFGQFLGTRYHHNIEELFMALTALWLSTFVELKVPHSLVSSIANCG